MMNATLSPAKVAKLQRAERELTVQQRKVLNAVPIAEPWTTNLVLAEIRRQGLNAEPNIVLGTLNTLVSDGLVREDSPGRWSRIPVPRGDATAPMTQAAAAPSGPAAAPVAAKADTLARIGDAAAQLRRASVALASLADDLDEIGIEVEDRIAQIGEGNTKLQQLRQLLGSI